MIQKTINQCPLVEWYKFKGSCVIKTCKFSTEMLESGCIAIERVDTNGKKLLTDRELRYYKFKNNISVMYVTQHRKKVMIRIKRIITLHYYIDYLFTNIQFKQYVLTKECENILNKAPFKLKKLNITPTVFANMLNVDNFNSFKNKVKLDNDFQIWDIFFLTQKRWESLNEDFKSAQD